MAIPAGHTKAELQSFKAILDPLGNVVGTYAQGGAEKLFVTTGVPDPLSSGIRKSNW